VIRRLLLLMALLFVPVCVMAQGDDESAPRVFDAKMRALDASHLITGDVKISLWGVRSVDNLPVVLAEKARVALDNAIGNENVTCELKERYSDYLLAQCVNGQDQDLGLLMLQSGYVSVDRAHIYNSVFEAPYLEAEKAAQVKEAGIWAAQDGVGSSRSHGSWLIIAALILLVIILAAFGVLTVIIMRGFQKVIEAQNQNIDMLGRERKLKTKERHVIASMLDSEIKANKSKIEAYLVVYEEMLSDMNNPQRQPKYKRAGDIVQTQPALDRSVFDRNTDKLGALGDKLSSEVVHFYARIKTKPDYINLEVDMPLDEATSLVARGIDNAKRMNKIADRLIDAFDDGGLSSDSGLQDD